MNQTPDSAYAPRQMHPRRYWATLDPNEFVNELGSRVDRYYYYLMSSGRRDTWDRSHRLHHQGIIDFGRMTFGGVSGEQVQLKVNNLRAITQHLVNLIANQRPAFDARAANADYDSEMQRQFAQALLDHDLRAKNLWSVARQALDYAIKYGEGYAIKTWDANSGETIAVGADDRPVKAGSLRFGALLPSEVIRDYSADDIGRNDWCIVRRWVNRYELAERFDKETERDRIDAIISAPEKYVTLTYHPMIGVMQGGFGAYVDYRVYENSDEIEVFDFYHNRTATLPAGRRATVIVGTGGQACMLDDGPLPYDRIPVFRIAAGNQDGLSFGYTQVFDSLPVQHMINHLYSAAATNNANFAVQSILTPMGQPLSAKQLGAGMVALPYDPAVGKPEALQLTKTSPETYEFLKMLEQSLQTNLGVNDVIRGIPQPSLKSGAALAMVASQTLQFLTGIQAEWVQFLEDIATGAVEDYKRFADLPQVVTIAGRNKRNYARTFTKDDLSNINRVVVDIGNPLSKTIAGRMELAQQLSQMEPKERADFIEVMETGRLEPVMEGELAEDMLIRGENERMSDGEHVITLATDNHAQHIMKHKNVLASPEARFNPALQKMVLEHIQEHIDIYKDISMNNPELMALTGQPPLPPEAPPMVPPGQPGGEGPVTGNPAVAAPDLGQPGASGAVGPEGANLPNMPNMPKLPTTGETVQGEVPGVPPPGIGA